MKNTNIYEKFGIIETSLETNEFGIIETSFHNKDN